MPNYVLTPRPKKPSPDAPDKNVTKPNDGNTLQKLVIKPIPEEHTVSVKLIDTDDDSQYLKTSNKLSEFETKQQKEAARENLGIHYTETNVNVMNYTPSEDIKDGTKSEKHGGLETIDVKDLRDNPINFNKLMDMILFPAQLPTITDPTIKVLQSDLVGNKQVGDALLTINNSNALNYISCDLGSVKFNNTIALQPNGDKQIRSYGWEDTPKVTNKNWKSKVSNGEQSLLITRDYKAGSKLYNSQDIQVVNSDKLDTNQQLKAGTAQLILQVNGFYLCYLNYSPLELANEWSKTSTAFGTFSQTTFDCPDSVTPKFQIKGLLGFEDDLGGNWESEYIETPKEVLDSTLKYKRYIRKGDLEFTSPGTFKINI